jgi:hypothetical protein
MQPKLGRGEAIVDLRSGSVKWLGYLLRWHNGRLEIRSSYFHPFTPETLDETYELLFEKFAKLHERENGWMQADNLMRSIIAYLGPTWRFSRPRATYDLITATAAAAGFEELSSFSDVLTWWQSNHTGWLKTCERVNRLSAYACKGSGREIVVT